MTAPENQRTGKFSCPSLPSISHYAPDRSTAADPSLLTSPLSFLIVPHLSYLTTSSSEYKQD